MAEFGGDILLAEGPFFPLDKSITIVYNSPARPAKVPLRGTRHKMSKAILTQSVKLRERYVP